MEQLEQIPKEIEEISSEENGLSQIQNKIFFNKYHCIKKLGEGSFGQIFKAEYNEEYFALKFENKKKGQNLLENEAAIMSYLKGPNIPYVKSYGYSGNYNILVMQLLGISLEDIFTELKRFSIKSVCILSIQMLNVLEYIHNKHIIHRDIKPDNFVMGLDDLSQYVYLLDFGLAKNYRSSSTLIHYPMIYKKKLTGTARYASINALKGYEQSRRDDLESVGYVLIYFLRGSLPWQGLQAKNKEERYKKILQKKIETTSYDLCYGFPIEFEKYVEYCKNLDYIEEPQYEMLRNLFLKIMRREKDKFDYIYDWTTEEELKMRKEVTMKTDVDSHGKDFRKNSVNSKRRRGSKIEENEENENIKAGITVFSQNYGNDNDKNEGNKNNNNNEETVCCSGCQM